MEPVRKPRPRGLREARHQQSPEGTKQGGSSPVANDGDVELLGSRENSVALNVERPGRVLDFDGGDGSCSDSTPKGLFSASEEI
jgi:hypothetical protein